MLQRCTNTNAQAYMSYGGRGITVCDRWRTFENFYADMGNPPKGKSLDRIDNNGNYEPGNCRWATQTQQNRNQRTTLRVFYNGKNRPLIEIAEECGVKYQKLYDRVVRQGWSITEAVRA